MRPPALSAIAAVFGIAVLAAAPAHACGPVVEVRFAEGSGGDRFEALNKSAGGWRLLKLTVDLAGSAGDLVFDTDRGGDGVQAYRDFAVIGGDAEMSRLVAPGDGGRFLAVEFLAFPPGASFRFTVDVDDRLPGSRFGQASIDPGEFAGAGAAALLLGPDGRRHALNGRFDGNDRALLGEMGCVS